MVQVEAETRNMLTVEPEIYVKNTVVSKRSVALE